MTSVLGAQLESLHTALKRPQMLSGLDADYRSVGRLAKRMSKFATANCPLLDAFENFCTVNSACSPVVKNYVIVAWAGQFVSLLVNRPTDR